MLDMTTDELLYDDCFQTCCMLTGFDLYAARACQKKLKQAISSDDEALIDEAWAEWKNLTRKDDFYGYCKAMANGREAKSRG